MHDKHGRPATGPYSHEVMQKRRLNQRITGLQKMKVRHAKEMAEAERAVMVLRAEIEYENSQKERGEA